MPIRSLNAEELAVTKKVFRDGLDTSRVHINEESRLPNVIGRIGALLKGQPAPTANAITIANTAYFPRKLKNDLVDMGWLIHELTHCWQYQHDGIGYLFQAAFASTYDFRIKGEKHGESLKDQHKQKKKFRDFNREQQGDIVRYYYFALNQPNRFISDEDISDWEPYMKEVHQPPR